MAADHQPGLHLGLLERPRLRNAAGGSVRLRTQKQYVLLARLADACPQLLPRSYLADLLWPDSAPQAARHSLNQALSELREAIGRAAVVCEGNTVGLASGVVTLHLGRDGPAGRPQTALPLEAMSVPNSPEYQQWRDTLAIRAWSELHRWLTKAIAAAKRSGRYQDVERLGLEVLQHDPLCEDGAEACVYGRVLAGDRIGALRVFEEFAEKLRAEVGTEPGSNLRRAAENLRRGVAPREAAGLALGPVPLCERVAFRPVPLIGRTLEFQRLHHQWDCVQTGGARQVVIRGEPGIGKTVLAMMLAASAHADGAAVARVQSHETERDAPYALLAELVRQLVRYPGATGTSGEALAELSHVYPDIRARFPGVREPPLLVPELQHLRLSGGLAALVDAVTDEQPVLLVADDLHLADEMSLVVVLRAVERWQQGRVLLVGTIRSTEVSRARDPLTALLGRTQGDGEFELRPLDDANVRELIRARAARPPGPEIESRIIRLAGGNPLAVEMLVRDWETQGDQGVMSSIDAVSPARLARTRIPDSIREAFEGQRRYLTESARQVLDVAAVLGHRLMDLDVYEALGATPMQVADATRQLMAAGIWADAGSALEFRNELIRTHAYLSIPRHARVELHRRVARVLARKADVQQAGPSLELARHLLLGARRHEAIVRALGAAEEGLRSYSPATAERAVTLFEGECETEAERSAFRYFMAQAFAMRSRFRAAEGPIRVACQDVLLDAVSRVDARLRLADLLMRRKTSACALEAVSEASTAVRAAETIGDIGLAAKAYRIHAQALAYSGRERDLPTNLARLEKIYAGRLDDGGELHFARGFTAVRLGDCERGKECLQLAAQAFESERQVEEYASAQTGLGLVLHRSGDWVEAREAFAVAHREYKTIDDDERAYLSLSNMAAIDLVTGHYDSAQQLLAEGTNLLEPGENSRNELWLRVNALHLALIRTDLVAARECLRDIRSATDSDVHWQVRFAALLASADYHLVSRNGNLALPLIAEASRLVDDRYAAVQEPVQFYRLEAYRRHRMHGPGPALQWLQSARQAIHKGGLAAQLAGNQIEISLEAELGTEVSTRQGEVSEQSDRIGLAPMLELRWCGFLNDYH